MAPVEERGTLVAVGGGTFSGGRWNPSREVAELDPATGQWARLPSLPGDGAILNAQSVTVGDELAIVARECGPTVTEDFACGLPRETVVWRLAKGGTEWEVQPLPDELAKVFNVSEGATFPVTSGNEVKLAGVLDGKLIVGLNNPAENSIEAPWETEWTVQLVGTDGAWVEIPLPPGLIYGNQLCATEDGLTAIGAELSFDEQTGFALADRVALYSFEVGVWKEIASLDTGGTGWFDHWVTCTASHFYVDVDFGNWWRVPHSGGSFEKIAAAPSVDPGGFNEDWRASQHGDGLVATTRDSSGRSWASVYDPATDTWTQPEGVDRYSEIVSVSGVVVDVGELTDPFVRSDSNEVPILEIGQ